MNKYFKKGIALAIVGMMTFGMGTTVFAETGGGTTTGTGLNTNTTDISDTSANTSKGLCQWFGLAAEHKESKRNIYLYD